MNVRYRVELSQEERAELGALLSGGKHAARKLKRAQILLAAAAGVSDEEIARSVGVGGSTVSRTKRRFVLGNLEAALSEEPRPGGARKLNGREEALLVATACSKPPTGRARWTLQLLAGAMVKLTEHGGLSRETVRRRLAENDLKCRNRYSTCRTASDQETHRCDPDDSSARAFAVKPAPSARRFAAKGLDRSARPSIRAHHAIDPNRSCSWEPAR
jgi:transposase